MRQSSTGAGPGVGILPARSAACLSAIPLLALLQIGSRCSSFPCATGVTLAPRLACSVWHGALVFARMRILIVEDELLVRMFAVDALEDAGFQVEQAGTAAEAMRAVEQLGTELHALIIDLGLPDRSGDQLAAELRDNKVDLPILIASGRSEREIRDRFVHDTRIGVLVKPYTAAMLIDALEKVGVTS